MGRPTDRYIAQNRKARHDYLIEDTIEAGLILAGSEVKSLRKGGVSINEAYAAERGGELYLMNANIPEYAAARINHEPRRARKLLLHKKELNRLAGPVTREGMALAPLRLYFNEGGRVDRGPTGGGCTAAGQGRRQRPLQVDGDRHRLRHAQPPLGLRARLARGAAQTFWRAKARPGSASE